MAHRVALELRTALVQELLAAHEVARGVAAANPGLHDVLLLLDLGNAGDQGSEVGRLLLHHRALARVGHAFQVGGRLALGDFQLLASIGHARFQVRAAREDAREQLNACLLYTSPSPRD